MTCTSDEYSLAQEICANLGEAKLANLVPKANTTYEVVTPSYDHMYAPIAKQRSAETCKEDTSSAEEEFYHTVEMKEQSTAEQVLPSASESKRSQN